MSKVDLHIHSCVSDGKFTPAEVVRKAVDLGLQVVALTDHDNVDGIVPAIEAARQFPGLTFIPGIEISTVIMSSGDDENGGPGKRVIRFRDGQRLEEPIAEVHMLGYFIDYADPELLETLKKSRMSREGRAKAMVEKLSELGVPVEWQRVQEIAGDGSIGRPHIARAMVEKGYVGNIKEAFDRYIAWGGPAFVERVKVSPEEAVAMIIKAGGLPVLAHPLFIKNPEKLVARLKPLGLVGIETYYKRYGVDEINGLLGIAGKYDLIPTGGTDYHGLEKNNAPMMGETEVPMASAEKLIVEAKKRGRAGYL